MHECMGRTHAGPVPGRPVHGPVLCPPQPQSTVSVMSNGALQWLHSLPLSLSQDTIHDTSSRSLLPTIRRIALVLLGLILLGAVPFAWLEGKTCAEAVYWACISLTTVGYGDEVPKTTAGKAFTTVYLLVAAVIFVQELTHLVDLPLQLRQARMVWTPSPVHGQW